MKTTTKVVVFIVNKPIPGGKMGTQVTWNGDMAFTGTADTGFEVNLDAHPNVGGNNGGFRPMELLGVGLVGCTAMDVISILKKKRQDVTDFQVRLHTTSAEDHPHVWTSVKIEYLVTGHGIDPKAVERAIQLSSERYCPAQNMIDKAVDIETVYQIIEAE
jgi:putative redox protein